IRPWTVWDSKVEAQKNQGVDNFIVEEDIGNKNQASSGCVAKLDHLQEEVRLLQGTPPGVGQWAIIREWVGDPGRQKKESDTGWEEQMVPVGGARRKENKKVPKGTGSEYFTSERLPIDFTVTFMHSKGYKPQKNNFKITVRVPSAPMTNSSPMGAIAKAMIQARQQGLLDMDEL
ncbi:hypothetical protein E2320_022724, partial [Naja naja]